MSDYDQWKGRSDRDDGPEEEFEPEQMNEADYALFNAEQSFDYLVQHWGEVRAKQMMFAIFLRHGIRDLKQRRAAVLNSWRTLK